jgi:NADPH:quinone reductase-like Zn-dependent oxidoreductase
LKVGDSVYAYLLWGGGWAEYCISNEGESAIKPKSLSFVKEASVPLEKRQRRGRRWSTLEKSSGQTVLIHGGSRAGSWAIQIVARGARVIATASTANQIC